MGYSGMKGSVHAGGGSKDPGKMSTVKKVAKAGGSKSK